MSERGSTGVALVAVVTVALLLGLVVADVAGYLMGRAHALTAADAAALAAAPVTFRPFGTARPPAGEAAAVAGANGARLVRCRCAVDRSWSPRRVEVEVELLVDLLLFGPQLVRARSRAEFVPARLPG